MYKPFVKVIGLHSIFELVQNDLGFFVYETDHLIAGTTTTYNVSEDSLFYIVTDSSDHNVGYDGTYLYSHGHLFSNYDNAGGQYIKTDFKNAEANAVSVFLFGQVTPVNVNSPWSITYHIQSYSNDEDFNSEHDVCIYGINNIVYSCFAFNAIGEHAPYKYHVLKTITGGVQVGLCLYDTAQNSTLNRSISVIISNYKDCQFSFDDSMPVSTLNDSIIIDADRQGFIDQANNDQLKIANVKINQIATNQLKNHAKLLYGFDAVGNIAPLVSVASAVPYSSPDNNRLYNTLGFDYTKGLYYSNNYDGVLTYVEGNIYSAFSGMEFGYFDNISSSIPALTLNPSKPVFIRGVMANGLFFIAPVVNTYTHCWVQDITETGIVYWFIGYPQKDGSHVNLFENNKLYCLEDNKIIEYNSHAKDISFTPSGTVSAPTFYGTEGNVSVSGVAEGTNAASAVTIAGTTASVNSMTTVGDLPSFEYTNADESIKFNQGALPEMEAVTVWTGYSAATASAQIFTGSTVTFTGKFTPAGTVSAPTFTGDQITIHT